MLCCASNKLIEEAWNNRVKEKQSMCIVMTTTQKINQEGEQVENCHEASAEAARGMDPLPP